MAGRFTEEQWKKINKELNDHPQDYGLPEGGREESLVLASFNIRKLGKKKDRDRELDFMARFCARCDLIAIQEVQDSLAALNSLHERVEKYVAGEGEYSLVVSDVTGKVPGEVGLGERFAFLYRWRRIRRLDMASDLTIDRTGVLKRLVEHGPEFLEVLKKWDIDNELFKAKKRKTEPKLVLPEFLTFIRTPHVVAFEAPAASGKPPLRFIAVNAHLVYGTMKERTEEFRQLISWLTHRLGKNGKMTAQNFVLMGNLNLKFHKPKKHRKEHEDYIRGLNLEVFKDANSRRIYFPFIDKHPRLKKVLRTNARHNQTFDQIAFFRGASEKYLPNDLWKMIPKKPGPDEFDFAVFNFANLFSRVVTDTAYLNLTKDQKDELGEHFENSVSDHLPIWVRIPRPGFRPPPQF